MLTLTWGFLNEPRVTSALHKLYNTTGLTSTTAYRAARICEAAQKEMGKAQKEAHKLLQKYALKNPKGEVLNFPTGPYKFESPDSEEKHEKEFHVLMEQTFEVKAHKLPFQELDNAKLTPGEVMSIAPLLDGIPDEVA